MYVLMYQLIINFYTLCTYRILRVYPQKVYMGSFTHFCYPVDSDVIFRGKINTSES